MEELNTFLTEKFTIRELFTTMDNKEIQKMRTRLIIEELKKFDMYYEMSDDGDVFSSASQHRNLINSLFGYMTDHQKVQIASEVDNDLLYRYFAKYFTYCKTELRISLSYINNHNVDDSDMRYGK